ncbi:MAG: ATP-binding cassette domain-containing protein [Betaproteobacteria bacterium]
MRSPTPAVPPPSSLADVTVTYADGRVALNRISLALAPGEQVAIIGPSGAGKTTLLATLACALKPSGGRVEVFGHDPWTMPGSALHALRGSLFLAPQVPPLAPRQRVVNAVLAGRLPRWTAWQALRSLVHPRDLVDARDALAQFRLDDKLFLRCDRLSGGERQRVGLARLLLSQAQLFLLDEPVSALDPALAGAALDVLQQAARERGATLVVSLHAVDLALSRFPRLIGLRHGEVLFDLPRAEVDDALLTSLYGTELGMSFQAPPSADEARRKLTRCL